jgi:hypothetical protein
MLASTQSQSFEYFALHFASHAARSRQQCRSVELRAVTSRAKLLQDKGRFREAKRQ